MDILDTGYSILDIGYSILDTRQASSIEHRESREQIAKDFESVLLNKLLDEMKNTIGDWGFDKDGICKQVQGIFWLYLVQDIANQGGLGLWKDIYESCLSADRFLTGAESATDGIAESLNKNI